jgi:SAM-dependent methyltransferase
VYLRLPVGDTPELIHRAIPARATILELGCGVGRITHPLLALGHHVVAVDNAPEMLRHVQGAHTVLADITTLRLVDQFDVAILASHLINTPDLNERRRLFEVCKLHVRAGGVVLIERYNIDWARTAVAEEHQVGDVTISWHDVRHDGDMLRAAVTYTVDGRSWTQRFTAEILDDAQLREEGEATGLVLDAWIGDQADWARFIA